MFTESYAIEQKWEVIGNFWAQIQNPKLKISKKKVEHIRKMYVISSDSKSSWFLRISNLNLKYNFSYMFNWFWLTLSIGFWIWAQIVPITSQFCSIAYDSVNMVATVLQKTEAIKKNTVCDGEKRISDLDSAGSL
jgi:hypothetical protein